MRFDLDKMLKLGALHGVSGGGGGGKSTTETKISKDLKPYIFGQSAVTPTEGHWITRDDGGRTWIPGTPGRKAITGLIPSALGAYANTSKDPYSGEIWAGPNADSLKGQDWLRSLANNMGTDFGQGVIDQANKTLAGDYLQVTPELNNYMDAASRPIQQNLMENILPSINSTAMLEGGGLGGSRQGIAQGQAIGRTNQAISDTRSGIAYQNYAAERQNQLNAADLLTKGASLNMLAPSMLMDVGGMVRADSQGQMDADLKKWQMAQDAPWAGLDKLANIIYGANPGGSSFTTNTPNPNPIGGAMGGAMTGAMLAKALGYAAGPWALGAGALGLMAGS